MRQRTARPGAVAPVAVRSVADPGGDRGALTDAAADADQGAHGAATGGDAHP
jgi:hypothetical protein